MYESIFEYGFDGTIPTFKDDTSKAIWEAVFPQLKANQKRYENGLRGGAPLNNQNAKKEQPNTKEKNNLNEENKTTKKQPNENENVNENDIVSMYVSKNRDIEEKENTACVRESYEDVMNEMGLEENVRPTMWEFIKHCQLGGKTIINSKLEDICIRLDMACGLTEKPIANKIQILKDAINGGYYDIKV